jgi:membrane fusion protein, multidrug efflux system
MLRDPIRQPPSLHAAPPPAPERDEAVPDAATPAPAPDVGRGWLKAGIGLLLLLLAAGAAYAWFSAPTTVRIAPAVRGQAAEIVYATGVVEPRSWAKVAPLVRERIVSLCDCEGEEVAEGDVLARLDDREPQAVLRELRARQDFTLRDLERLSDLAARSVGTRQDLERAESEEARIEALIAAQETRLEAYVLRAPLAGVVLRQEGEVGEVADPGSVLFWVGQPRPLRIVAEVNEEDIPRVRPGQRTLVRADAFPDQALEATVESLTPMGDPVARTYRVRFALPDDTPVLIGMSVEVNVVTAVHEDALLVPAAALGPDGSVWVARDGRAERRELAMGIRGATHVEVTEGLSEGETVILSAPAGLAEGARVRVEPET